MSDLFILGTTRVFRLREVIPTDEAEFRQARTLNIPLPHNSVRQHPSYRSWLSILMLRCDVSYARCQLWHLHVW